MELYEALYFKPELQMLIEKHYEKLIFHERLKKAQEHLEKNFIRHPLPGSISYPDLDIFRLDFRVGKTKKVNYHWDGIRQQLSFINIDRKNECFVYWGDEFFTKANATRKTSLHMELE